MIPHGFALDIERAENFVLAAGGAGTYGAPQSRALERGMYLAISDGEVGVRVTDEKSMRVDASDGSKLEVPVTPAVPLPVIVRKNVVVAAKDGACMAWLVPLVPITEEAAAFVQAACAA